VLPYVDGWLAIEQEIDTGVIKPLLADARFDYRAARVEGGDDRESLSSFALEALHDR
jgi:hypothetical protein